MNYKKDVINYEAICEDTKNWRERKEQFAKSAHNWQALQHFYKMKSVLLPEFMERNRRNLGDIESKLIKQYEDKDYGMDTSPHGATSLKIGYKFNTKKQEVEKN